MFDEMMKLASKSLIIRDNWVFSKVVCNEFWRTFWSPIIWRSTQPKFTVKNANVNPLLPVVRGTKLFGSVRGS